MDDGGQPFPLCPAGDRPPISPAYCPIRAGQRPSGSAIKAWQAPQRTGHQWPGQHRRSRRVSFDQARFQKVGCPKCTQPVASREGKPIALTSATDRCGEGRSCERRSANLAGRLLHRIDRRSTHRLAREEKGVDVSMSAAQPGSTKRISRDRRVLFLTLAAAVSALFSQTLSPP